MQVLPKVVLGIDPGTLRSGFGVVRGLGRNLECVDFGYKDLRNCRDDAHKLEALAEWVCGLIKTYAVEEVAIERPFLGKNTHSFLKLARAQGAVMVSASSLGCKVFEYAPNTIKSASVGYGLSSKGAVVRSLEMMLKIKFSEKPVLDASDALAVALTHLARQGRDLQILSNTQGSRSGRKNTRALWSAYVRKLQT